MRAVLVGHVATVHLDSCYESGLVSYRPEGGELP